MREFVIPQYPEGLEKDHNDGRLFVKTIVPFKNKSEREINALVDGTSSSTRWEWPLAHGTCVDRGGALLQALRDWSSRHWTSSSICTLMRSTASSRTHRAIVRSYLSREPTCQHTRKETTHSIRFDDGDRCVMASLLTHTDARSLSLSLFAP